MSNEHKAIIVGLAEDLGYEVLAEQRTSHGPTVYTWKATKNLIFVVSIRSGNLHVNIENVINRPDTIFELSCPGLVQRIQKYVDNLQQIIDIGEAAANA